MKFVILHGTGSTSRSNWLPWLKSELEALSHDVWTPDLPNTNAPNLQVNVRLLLDSGYDFANAILMGHSSGSIVVNGVLQNLPASVRARAAILVGTFRGDLGREDLRGIATEFNYDQLSQKTGKFIVVHSDDDPVCPVEGARWVADRLRAEFVLLRGGQHFSIKQDPRFNKFPELLAIIKTRVLSS